MRSKHYIKLDDNSFTNIIGFGILSSFDKRLKNYIGATGCNQEFAVLYVGPSDLIRELESFVKQKWKHDSLHLGKWVFEWLDPASNKSLDDLEKFFDDKIAQDQIPIRKIKREHLPFITGLGKPLYTMKDVKDEPDNYLEPLPLTKTKYQCTIHT